MLVREADRRTGGGPSALHEAAWGGAPGIWPLPSARTAAQRWDRAVVLGGQGRYSLGIAELDALEHLTALDDALASLALSTRASWLRQIGRHGEAARYDGAAVATIGLTRDASSHLVVEARCDALTGLAADALGSGGFGRAATLLTRCARVLAECDGDSELWRPRLRLQWVSAELAMMSGDGATAVRRALDAREVAGDIDSLRHRVKTDLIVAAAYSSVGDLASATAGAEAVLGACSEHGLVPLRWASAMLLDGLGAVTPARAIVAECEAVLGRRGGILAGSRDGGPSGSIGDR
ncbi:hypothetical protein [Rhodococcoides kyotonense]|uniref:MalT-like TPR region domain-containing protein n=1 Tax=Rhodococcoides kyotonense TaxID=398843 RepID=A0A239MQJ5_9NOCA|nr:hypothetical protein [Rhodococcus kyotonensis]SNT44228.1 hypothetical protein SAMN05421642_12027 [Rhodococcus kyotonensis]